MGSGASIGLPGAQISDVVKKHDGKFSDVFGLQGLFLGPGTVIKTTRDEKPILGNLS